MSDRLHRWLVMVVAAIVSILAQGAALADPYSPSVADLHSLQNWTSSFSGGNQLSTIDAITVAPDGIHLDVTWRVGEGTADPFVTYPGETFSRVVLGMNTNNDDGGLGRLISPPYDGIKWCLMTDTPVFAQPFLQTAPDWAYRQPASGGYNVPGDMSSAMVALDFALDGVPNDVNGEVRSNAFGIQLFGPAPALGESISGHIWITNWAIPEPTTAMLAMIGLAGIVVRARRR